MTCLSLRISPTYKLKAWINGTIGVKIEKDFPNSNDFALYADSHHVYFRRLLTKTPHGESQETWKYFKYNPYG